MILLELGLLVKHLAMRLGIHCHPYLSRNLSGGKAVVRSIMSSISRCLVESSTRAKAQLLGTYIEFVRAVRAIGIYVYVL
jgi:hypothetical protein